MLTPGTGTQLRWQVYQGISHRPKKETDLIPANTGISDMNIETQITAYNATKLKRDRLISDSSDNEPVVKN